MKKTLLSAALLLPLYISAQTAPTPIAVEGIGKFKIGKTTLSIIPELEQELGGKVKQAFTYAETSKLEGKRGIIELVPDTVSRFGGPIYASQCPAVKVYWLPQYTVADMALRDVRLKFYNGVLAEFHCDQPSELKQALTLKYGEPRSNVEEQEVACTLKYSGQSFKRKGQTYTLSWGTETMPANYVVSKYYNSACEEKILSYFSVYDAAVMKATYSCERTITDRRKARADNDKKKKLGDL